MTTQRRRKPRNPREVLEAIAFDPDAPAHARVAAAKALLQLARSDKREPEAISDAVTRRAIELLDKRPS